MAITLLPTPPQRSDPVNFATRADAFLTAIPVFAVEANTLATDVSAKQVISSAAQVSASASQVSATASQISATASAAAAAASSNSTIWVSGTTYAVGDVRFSPINFLSYRRKTAGSGTTDPSNDITNWIAINYGDGTATGSGSIVLSNSPVLVTPALGTPASGVLTNVTGLPLTSGVTGILPVISGGTGVATSTGSGKVVLSVSPTLTGAAIVENLSFSPTSSLTVPVGDTSQRPSGVNGQIRYNTLLKAYEGYNTAAWASLGGGATGAGGDAVFVQNSKAITTSYAIPATQNASSVGPITVPSGLSVTVPSGSRWVIL